MTRTTSTDTQRQQLLALKADAEARIDRFETHFKHEDGPVSADFADQATEVENDEAIAALLEATAQELSMIKSAVARIDDGTYGMCSSCGQDISTARLQALPTTNNCIDCASDT